jgi:hypothetical protein
MPISKKSFCASCAGVVAMSGLMILETLGI